MLRGLFSFARQAKFRSRHGFPPTLPPSFDSVWRKKPEKNVFVSFRWKLGRETVLTAQKNTSAVGHLSCRYNWVSFITMCVCTSNILCVLSCRLVNNSCTWFLLSSFISWTTGVLACGFVPVCALQKHVCTSMWQFATVSEAFFATKPQCSKRLPVLDGISFSAGSQETTRTPSASEGHYQATLCTQSRVCFFTCTEINSLRLLVVVLSDYRLLSVTEKFWDWWLHIALTSPCL